MESNRRVVVYAGTRNIYGNMVTAVKSLLEHTRVDRVYFLTEDDVFPEWLPEIIEIRNVSGQRWFDPDGVNARARWGYMALMKLALCEVLPEEKRVLWMDVDTIVNRDIGELLDMDLEGKYVGAAEEPIRRKDPFRYYNTGVMLMDLEKLRDGTADRLIRLANERRMTFPDQDAVNLLLQTEIKEISPEWNSNRWIVEVEDAAVTHYAADKEYWTRAGWIEKAKREWRVKDADKV